MSVRGLVRSPHMAKLQAAGVPTSYCSCAPRAAARWDRQTDGQMDGSRYRLMPYIYRRAGAIGVNATVDAGDTSPAIFGQPGMK